MKVKKLNRYYRAEKRCIEIPGQSDASGRLKCRRLLDPEAALRKRHCYRRSGFDPRKPISLIIMLSVSQGLYKSVSYVSFLVCTQPRI